ncbi:MAG: pseudouridine synthase [Oscillospiraceae bacterium]|nr:pseudouridine synthase [Oscillospiraceae bacterium]
MQRLDKILSEAGAGSRKELRSVIRAGLVTVDGAVARREDEKFDEQAVTITLRGARVALYRTVWLMMNKPIGYVTSTQDPRDQTVMELLPAQYRTLNLFPVGRLDKLTQGLLLFTNDGDAAHRLTSPGHAVKKVYEAWHEGQATAEDAAAFLAGLALKDGTICRPGVLEPLGPGHSRITVTEGKYHQVRRMMAARGMTVTALRRVREGTLTLADLEVGACRELTKAEVLRLNCEI